MEYINNTVCVTMHELICSEEGEAVMSRSNYEKLLARGRMFSFRPGKGLGSYALIEFASLPERFRKRFIDKYGDPAQIIKKELMNDTLKIDTKARKFYAEEFVLPNGKHLPDDKIEEYALNASVLNVLLDRVQNMKTLRKALGNNTKIFWETLVGTSETLRKTHAHTLPENSARLRDKINTYKREGYESLISRKFCNENTLKITEEAGNLLVALKRSRVPVYSSARIFTKFNEVAAAKGWRPLKSEKSMLQFLNRPDIQPLWYDAVHGEMKAYQRYKRRHKTILPTLRDELWYSDGTKLNLYYRGCDSKNNTVKLTTGVYEVMDAATEVLLGYHISESESADTMRRAFRMAITTAMHKPYEIVFDNQSGYKPLAKSGFFDRIKGKLARTTEPYNAPSKTIESAFKRFQDMLAEDWRFTGRNITSKGAESRPNMEFIDANVKNLFTYEEMTAAYIEFRQKWNWAPHPQTGVPRMQMYLNSVNPETYEIDQWDMIDMFWETTELPSTYTTSGITIQVDKREYTYEVFAADGDPDMEFYDRNTFAKFWVKYDTDDMTKVKLYDKNAAGEFRFVADARPFATIHRARQSQKEGEMSFISRMQQKELERRVTKQIAAAELETAHGVAPEQFGLIRPRLKGINANKAEQLMDKQIRTTQRKERSTTIPTIVDLNKIISNMTYDQIDMYNKL